MFSRDGAYTSYMTAHMPAFHEGIFAADQMPRREHGRYFVDRNLFRSNLLDCHHAKIYTDGYRNFSYQLPCMSRFDMLKVEHGD